MEFERASFPASKGGRVHGSGALEVAHELIQSLLMLGFAEAGQVGVDGGDDGAFVAEVDLDLTEVLALFEKVGGVGMAQGMDMGCFFDAAGVQSEPESALQSGAIDRLGGGACAQATVTLGGKEPLGMAMGLPLLAEQLQSALGQGHVTIAIAFAGADVKEHAFTVDVGNLDVQALA